MASKSKLLTEAEVLKMPKSEYMNAAQLRFFRRPRLARGAGAVRSHAPHPQPPGDQSQRQHDDADLKTFCHVRDIGQLVRQLPAAPFRIAAWQDGGERIHRLAVNQQIELYHI